MKNNEIVNLVDKIDDNQFDYFMEGKSSKIEIFEDLHSVQFDYSWLDKMEEILPYLDAIVRKPRKFIMQEEEIVPIEKAKKISLETIRHLAQHTNLIQDVSEDGTITPIAVLNVHKEESYDIYENRFIYSLIVNIKGFIQMRKAIMGAGEIFNLNRKIKYAGQAKLNGEMVKVDVTFESNKNNSLANKNPNQEDEKTRLAKIELIINDYFNSLFIRELKGAVMVKSPIRRTNVILKDQNFKKVLELWEFLEEYDVRDRTEMKHQQFVEDTFGVENNFGIAFFLNYFSASLMEDKSNEFSSDVNKYYIKKLVEYFMNNNFNIDQKKFKKIVDDQFKEVEKEIDKEHVQVYKVINSYIDEYYENKQEIFKLLKGK